MKRRLAVGALVALVLTGPLTSPVRAAEEWEEILLQALQSDYSQTRHNGLKGIDTSTPHGLKVLWKVLDGKLPFLAKRDAAWLDWYVREGAYDALLRAEGEEAAAEIERVLEGRGNEAAKEAVVFSVIWKLRREFVKVEGKNEDEWIEDAKVRLRKTRGVESFKLILPTIQKVDPDGRLFERIRLAFEDKSSRVRTAAITGFMAYPHDSSLPLLFGQLEALEKKKSKYYREWVMTRFALEQLTGQDFREDVEAWLRWWKEERGGFTVARRIEEAEEKERDAQDGKRTVTRGDVTIDLPRTLVRGKKDGYPLLVLPWRQWEPDYFRPYFHGIEEDCLVYYVQMPKVSDFKGLTRDAASNLVKYPTELLAEALVEIMTQAKLPRFGVLGHGPESSTLAMKLAAAHPDSVSHLVLINPRSSASDFSAAIDRVIELGRKRQVRELEKGGESILIGESGAPIYKAADSDEAGGLGRALQNQRFADPSDPAVGQFNYLYESGDPTQTLADDQWKAAGFFDGRAQLPVLLFHGAQDPWVSAADVHKVAGIFPRAQVVTLDRCAQFPFMFETWAFNGYVRKFLAKEGRRR